MQARVQVCERTVVWERKTRDYAHNISVCVQNKAQRNEEWKELIETLDFGKQQMRRGLSFD